ncbi:MAG: hypothetical protein IPP72_21890 [Chitinophagaceae bacterium]|nr:hypothetical protein [Chitinophagaceae bacterium]
MRKNLLVIFLLFFALSATAQSGFVFNCTRDTVLSCTESCITLQGYIPNIHSLADDYVVSPLNSGFCSVQIPSSNVQGSPTNINRDDEYTQVIPLPFDFPFYGIYYSQLVAGSNGIISFDDANANGFCHYGILSTGFGLGATAGTPEDLPSTLYDRAIIMGPYHDIDIFAPPSPNKKVYYQVDGVAPYRRWILAFFEIPLFLTSCNASFKNTHQIILNESTGVIDIYIYDKQICPGWNEGRAMVGLQNYDQDKGIMAPGRAASDAPWGSVGMNEAWRFTPKDGPSLFQRVELLDNGGAVVATGDTTSVSSSVFAVSFPNFCPAASGLYVIKSTYLKIDDPTVEVYGYDTVNVIKNTSVPPVTADTTQAVCGGNGTITVTAPLGANYEYSIDNGVTYQDSPSFTTAPGHYTVLVHDKTGICTNSKEVDVTSTSPLIASAVSTNTSCPGVSNGSIAVHVSQGIAGFTFLIDTMTIYQTDSVFNGLGAGTHVVTVKDNAGCTYVFNSDVNSDVSFTTTATSTNASCLGVANGSITVVQPSSGTAPFQYSSDDGTTYQNGTVLTGLAGGNSYQVKVKDASGCTYSFTQLVNNSAGVTATFSSINSACTGVSTGQIVITPTAGTAPFYYSTDGGLTYPALDTIRSLASGSYNIKVKDAVGCIYDSPPVTVSNNIGVTATFTTINSACSGVSTGQIVISPTAGTAPFYYSTDGGLTYPALDTIRNLASGSYNIKVKDAVGCIYDSPPVTVSNNIGVTATFTTINSACSGVSTGQIVITPTAGTAPFYYSTDGGLTYPAMDTIRNLASGSYNVKVKDAVGCIYDSPP